MRKVIKYQCETCLAVYDDEMEARSCEAVHLGLSNAEISEWGHLRDECNRLANESTIHGTEENRREFDLAIEALTKFEKEHNIIG